MLLPGNVTRRDFLQLGMGLAAAALAGCGSSSTDSGFVPATSPASPTTPTGIFPQPPLIGTSAGRLNATLNVVQASNTVGKQLFNVASYNGSIPGPTLRVQPGSLMEVLVDNQLPPNTDGITDPNLPHHPNTTNFHTHGMHVSPRTPQDNIFLAIEPGQSFEFGYQIPGNHPPGTYWYHPHVHGSAAVQVMGGMAGALIVEGDIDRVPEVAAARDIVVLFSQLRTGLDGTMPSLSNESAFIAATAPTVTWCVNGVANPTLTARRGEVVRLRLLNASSNTAVPVTLAGHQMLPISRDGNSLATLQLVDSLLMAPGNRYDVLVQVGAPGTYELTNLAFNQGGAPPLTAGEVQLLTLVVTESAEPAMQLPTTLTGVTFNPPVQDSELTGRRSLTFEERPANSVFTLGEFLIDGRKFNPLRTDQVVQLGAVEEWTIFNTSTGYHPFHIHINPFQIVSVNGERMTDTVWADTVLLPPQGQVVIRSRFKDFTGPYVLHCHILLHECVGMMQVVNVVDPTASAQERKRHARHARRLVDMTRPSKKMLAELCNSTKPIPVFRWGPPARAEA